MYNLLVEKSQLGIRVFVFTFPCATQHVLQSCSKVLSLAYTNTDVRTGVSQHNNHTQRLCLVSIVDATDGLVSGCYTCTICFEDCGMWVGRVHVPGWIKNSAGGRFGAAY